MKNNKIIELKPYLELAKEKLLYESKTCVFCLKPLTEETILKGICSECEYELINEL